MTLPGDEIEVQFDEESRSFYAIWRPMTAVGMGGTEREALEDLRAAAHFGVDTAVDIRLAEIGPHR